jgi:hypothetical protein
MSVRGQVLPALMVIIGIAILVRTIFAGGGPIATGVLLGVLFCAAGAGRLWVERRHGGGR